MYIPDTIETTGPACFSKRFIIMAVKNSRHGQIAKIIRYLQLWEAFSRENKHRRELIKYEYDMSAVGCDGVLGRYFISA